MIGTSILRLCLAANVSVAAAVDREAEVRREPVVEQLDALAVGREHGRDAGILRVVLHVEALCLKRGERLTRNAT